jgi:hypothetical protein
LNIWTNAETGQDRKGLVFNMFLEIFESKEEKRKLRKERKENIFRFFFVFPCF